MTPAAWLRWIVYALAGVQTAALVFVLVVIGNSGLSDPLGRSIAIALVAICSVPWLLLTLPALLLRNRAPRLALGLVLAAYVVTWLVWTMA